MTFDSPLTYERTMVFHLCLDSLTVTLRTPSPVFQSFVGVWTSIHQQLGIDRKTPMMMTRLCPLARGNHPLFPGTESERSRPLAPQAIHNNSSRSRRFEQKKRPDLPCALQTETDYFRSSPALALFAAQETNKQEINSVLTAGSLRGRWRISSFRPALPSAGPLGAIP